MRFRYKARSIVKAHMGEGWTDALPCRLHGRGNRLRRRRRRIPARLTDLASFFWPEIQEATGTDFDAINARREAAREKAEKERERRAYDKLVRDAGDRLREGNLDAVKALLREETDRLRTQERHWHAEPVRNVADELGDHEARLAQWRGREFIGLPQKTLPKLDTLTLGLRGLMLLAAAPNVGKTALAIQLGLDAVVHNKDAAFLFVSLEMSRWDMLTRLRSRLAGLDWHALVFGSGRGGVNATFTPEEYRQLEAAQRYACRYWPPAPHSRRQEFSGADAREDPRPGGGPQGVIRREPHLRPGGLSAGLAGAGRRGEDAPHGPRRRQVAHRANEGASGRDRLGERHPRHLGSAQALERRSGMGGRHGRGHGSGARDLYAGHGPPSQSVVGRGARQARSGKKGNDAKEAGKARREVEPPKKASPGNGSQS